MSFEAYYDGVCAKGQDRIQVGDLIEREISRSRVGTYSHVVCPEPEPTVVDLGPREKVCPDCHLVHPGGC